MLYPMRRYGRDVAFDFDKIKAEKLEDIIGRDRQKIEKIYQDVQKVLSEARKVYGADSSEVKRLNDVWKAFHLVTAQMYGFVTDSSVRRNHDAFTQHWYGN